MKVGKMEGSPQEIKDLCENNGLNIEDYLEKPEQPLGKFWFIAPGFLFVLSIVVLTLTASLQKSWQTLVFLLGCCCALWLAVSVQLRFKNTWATTSIAIGGLLLMLVALGAVTPQELLQHAKDFKSEKE